MTAPLAGLRVLELTNVLSGPFCGHQLAHMGAEVIKVEPPGRGEFARQLGADTALNDRDMGASFLAQNAGKKSVTLDLKHPEAVALFVRLADTADVVLENFRPGVMDRLGIGAEVLRARNPELVYCAISGFGQDGPWARRPAYDQIVQGMAGAMSVTGAETPTRAGWPVADTVAGLTAAFAVAAALNARPRGCTIDVSMLDTLLASMGWVVSNLMIAGAAPARHGNDNPTSSPSGTFRAADGLLNVAANKAPQWEALARHVGRADLLADPRFATREDRIAHRAELTRALDAAFRAKPAARWAQELSALGVPAGEVLDVADALAAPQVAARGLVADWPDVPGAERGARTLRTGFRVDGAAPAVDAPAPALGADAEAVWGALGLSSADIARLREAGAL